MLFDNRAKYVHRNSVKMHISLDFDFDFCNISVEYMMLLPCVTVPGFFEPTPQKWELCSKHVLQASLFLREKMRGSKKCLGGAHRNERGSLQPGITHGAFYFPSIRFIAFTLSSVISKKESRCIRENISVSIGNKPNNTNFPPRLIT